MNHPLLPADRRLPNTVYGVLRDRSGNLLGYMHRGHDGTDAGMKAATLAAQHAADRAGYDWSGINSQWIATDGKGKPAWKISHNTAVIDAVPGGSAERAMRRKPARGAAGQGRLESAPVAMNPAHRHAPAVTAAFRAHGFELYNTGGDMLAYRLANPTVGEVLVTDDRTDGGVPHALSHPVAVGFYGLQHSEPLVEMRFRSGTAFLASVVKSPWGTKTNGKAAAGRGKRPRRAKRNDWRSYQQGIREAVKAGKPWHSEVMLPRGGSFFVRVRPLANGAWQPEIEADERHEYDDAVRALGREAVTALISRSVDMDLGFGAS